jgi:hypothetical protein
MDNNAPLLLGFVIPSIPFLAVALVGLAVSLSRKARYPRAARWAITGFVCLLLQVVLSFLQQYMLSTRDGSANAIGLVWMVPASYFLRFASLVAIAVAIFSDRQNAQQRAAVDV